jgi:hypothetical protein
MVLGNCLVSLFSRSCCYKKATRSIVSRVAMPRSVASVSALFRRATTTRKKRTGSYFLSCSQLFSVCAHTISVVNWEKMGKGHGTAPARHPVARPRAGTASGVPDVASSAASTPSDLVSVRGAARPWEFFEQLRAHMARAGGHRPRNLGPDCHAPLATACAPVRPRRRPRKTIEPLARAIDRHLRQLHRWSRGPVGGVGGALTPVLVPPCTVRAARWAYSWRLTTAASDLQGSRPSDLSTVEVCTLGALGAARLART